MIITNNAYLYDGSLEGLLSVIFEIYQRKELPDTIQTEHAFQPNLEQQIFIVETDLVKAERVKKGLKKKAGRLAWEKLTKAFLSHELEKGMIIFNYIQLALEIGFDIHTHLSHDSVLTLEQLIHRIQREYDRWIGFIRFAKMQAGFYYAAYQPKSNMTPLIMPFFSERFCDQPFLIHDTTRNLVGVYTLKEWYLIEVENFILPEYSDDEKEYTQVWKTFYHTVAIPERKNARQQKTMMPLWYRANMTEFKK